MEFNKQLLPATILTRTYLPTILLHRAIVELFDVRTELCTMGGEFCILNIGSNFFKSRHGTSLRSFILSIQ